MRIFLKFCGLLTISELYKYHFWPKMTAFLQLKRMFSSKERCRYSYSRKRYIFVYVYLTLTCFSTICLVRLLSCQIGFRWAAFVKASITSHLLFLTYPSLDALTPFTSMIGKTVFHYYIGFRTYVPFVWLLTWMACNCKQKDAAVKFRYSEKVTKIWKNLPFCFDITKWFWKKVGDFFQILWPPQNICTVSCKQRK